MAVRAHVIGGEFSSPAARTASHERRKSAHTELSPAWPQQKTSDYLRFVTNSLWNEQVAKLIANILERSVQIMKIYPTSYNEALRMSFAEHIQVNFLSSSVSEEVGRLLAQLLDMGIMRQRDQQPLLHVIIRYFRTQLLEELAETYYRGVILLKWNCAARSKNAAHFARKLKRHRFAHKEFIKRELIKRGLNITKRVKIPLDMREIDNQQTSFHDFTYLCINSTQSEGDSMLLGAHQYSPVNLIKYPPGIHETTTEADLSLDLSEDLESRIRQKAKIPKNIRDRADQLVKPQKELVFRRMTLVGKSVWVFKELLKVRVDQEAVALQHYQKQQTAKRNSIFRAMVSVVWLQQRNLLDSDSLEECELRA